MFARQLLRLRQDAGWTATELAKRVTDQGVPLRRQAVEEVERGQRQVRLNEAVAIAVVLQAPLGIMLFGLGQVDAVGLGPDQAVHPAWWQGWLEGDVPAPGVSPGDDTAPMWHAQQQPIRLYQERQARQATVVAARKAVESAKPGPERDKHVRRFLAACQRLNQVEEKMRREGVGAPPEWHGEFLAYVRQLHEEAMSNGEH